MATMAAFFKRTEAAAIPEYPIEATDPYRLRALPSEDVYFFQKRIDNSRVVREADPAAGKKCWRAVSMSFIAALALVVLMLPNALSMMAGYQIHSLERERERLINDRSRLELEEASLLSPERLEQWARELKMVDPAPERVVYLAPAGEGSLAMNVKGK